MIAHVAGVPVEELLLLVFASGAGAGHLTARAWIASHVPFTPRAKRPVAGPGRSATDRSRPAGGQAQRRR
jgi:hypothetical protein